MSHNNSDGQGCHQHSEHKSISDSQYLRVLSPRKLTRQKNKDLPRRRPAISPLYDGIPHSTEAQLSDTDLSPRCLCQQGTRAPGANCQMCSNLAAMTDIWVCHPQRRKHFFNHRRQPFPELLFECFSNAEKINAELFLHRDLVPDNSSFICPKF